MDGKVPITSLTVHIVSIFYGGVSKNDIPYSTFLRKTDHSAQPKNPTNMLVFYMFG